MISLSLRPRRARRPLAGEHSRRGSPTRNLLRLAVLAAICIIYALSGNASNLFLLNSCLLAVVSALALSFLMGTAGQPSLGTTAFLGLGGFGTIAMMRAGLPFGVAIIGCVIAASLGGLLLGLPSLRLRGVYLALATLGAYFFMNYFAQDYQDHVAGPAGFVLFPLFGTSPDLVQQRYWCLLLFGVVAITSIGIQQLTSGRAGRALRMIRDHEAAAPALGIPVARYKLAAFMLYAVVTAIAGALGAEFLGNVSTDSYSLTAAISYVAMIIIGGMDSVTGAMIGAFVVTLLPTWVSDETTAIAGSSFAASYGSSVSEGIYGLAILVLVTSGRGGLVGFGTKFFDLLRRWLRLDQRFNLAAPAARDGQSNTPDPLPSDPPKPAPE
jgi:branched-chain amino acid transport system permease protein